MAAPTRHRDRRVPAPPDSIETAEPSWHGRLAADPARGDFRGYVIACMICALAVVGSVGGLNAVVDPYGTLGTKLVPTAIESDRAIKIALLENLKRPPGILILGSSRSRPAAPRYLERLTGHTGFNAGVTGGDTADEWVFAHLMAKRFPGASRRYLIFINVGIGGAGANPQLAADPLARPYLTAQERSSGESLLHKIADYLSVQATRDSLRVVRACVLQSCSQRWFHADGSLLPSRVRTTARQRTSFLESTLAGKLAAVRARPESTRPPSPTNLRAFARLIAWMDSQGATPLVVMNPLHPALLRALERDGGFARHTWAVRHLQALGQRHRFDFIDLTDVRTFAGLPNGFADPTHVSLANMRLMLRYIVAHDHGIL